MSIYNTLTVEKVFEHQVPSGPHKKGGHKVQHRARGTAVSPGFGYPDLYIEIAFKSDSETKLINPANVWTKDVIIMVSPYRGTLSESFDAPTIGVDKTVTGPRLEYSIRCSVKLASAEASVGIKDYVNVKKTFSAGTGIVIVKGWLNTVTGEGACKCEKIGAPDGKMHVE